jgi:hypothetical protein
MEEWKVIIEFPDYVISSSGRVKRLIKGQGSRARPNLILKGYINGAGRRQVELWEKSNRKKLLVHKLVMEAFIGPCPVGMEINHLDRNPLNNFLSNLEYCTPKQNTRHAMENGGGSYFPRGEGNPKSKLTSEDVIEIRNLISEGYSHRCISSLFNVSLGAISEISKKRNWSWL